MKKIIWFTNSHEHRNHLLKYGLMQLDQKKKIKFVERDNSSLLDYQVSSTINEHVHRHTSFLIYINGNKTKKILLDSEDSFVHLCPLIKDVDIYFCAAYNTNFHLEKKFVDIYEWQSEEDVIEYRKKSQDLILNFGEHFYKIRKFIPIGPNLSQPISRSLLQQKKLNVIDKVFKIFLKQRFWKSELEMFESRYQYMLKLRSQNLIYDVVLYDTLWGGWARHRYSLHVKLKDLCNRFKIHSVLKWDETAATSEFKKEQFPIISNPIQENYEEMLASSRLGVFATGFHWGWRNIMTLSLLFGIPIYMDKPILEPYFDFNEFQIYNNNDGWDALESYINQIDSDIWIKTKQHNQSVYDKYMTPEKVAEYFINTLDT